MEEEYPKCFLCGRNGTCDRLERHHIFGGSNRDKSDKYGLVVLLCGERCHRNGKNAVHRNAITAQRIHEYGQLKWMREQGKTEDDFRKEFGRSYI